MVHMDMRAALVLLPTLVHRSRLAGFGELPWPSAPLVGRTSSRQLAFVEKRTSLPKGFVHAFCNA
jgi:hypothetical protein